MTDVLHYSVAVRTLGQAGEKYEAMIRSLEAQTIKADKIVVYIAEGYPLPVRVGDEQYVYCPKGMVTQRARTYDEIDSEYLLLCDDDILFEPDSVERLFDGLQRERGDVVSANVYHNDRWPLKEKLIQSLFHGLCPDCFGKYAFRVRRCGFFNYHLHPRDVMLTQCFAGACILLPKTVFQAVSLQEETWMDRSGYPLGEDLVFAYKLHRFGYKVLVHSRCGIVHQDAMSGHVQDKYEDYYLAWYIRYLIWYRTIWQPAGPVGKLLANIAFRARWTFRFMLAFLSRVTGRNPHSDHDMIRAVSDAGVFARSAEFSIIPAWKVSR